MEQPRNPVVGATTVHLAVPLVSGETEVDTLCGELSFTATDPYAVTLQVATPTGPVRWTFSRDLLAEGIYEPSGDGDVQVWPCLSTEAEAVVIIELHAPSGDAMLQTPTRAVQAFVTDIYRAVPPGTESAHLRLDDLVAQLLAV